MSADAHVMSMDFPFSALSVFPEEVTMRIQAIAVITRHPSVRRFRIVFAARPHKFFACSSVLLVASVHLAVNPLLRYSLGLKVKLVDIRLSSGRGASAYVLL